MGVGAVGIAARSGAACKSVTAAERNQVDAVKPVSCVLKKATVKAENSAWLRAFRDFSVGEGEQVMGDEKVIGAFSEEQVSLLTNVSLHQLRRWDREGFFAPSYGVAERHVPYGRLYSFRDIVSLRVLNDLRNDKGISLQHLKEVSRKLAHLGDARWTATTLYVLGKRVVFTDPRTRLRSEIVSGQRVFDIPLRVAIASTRKAVQALNQRDDVLGKIVRNKFVAQNQHVFAGTRIPVRAVREFADAGYSVQKIIAEYPDLTPADVAAALASEAAAA